MEVFGRRGDGIARLRNQILRWGGNVRQVAACGGGAGPRNTLRASGGGASKNGIETATSTTPVDTPTRPPATIFFFAGP